MKSIFLKYTLEIEIIIKSLTANIVSEKYVIENYLDKRTCFDSNVDIELIKKLVFIINEKSTNLWL